MPRTDDKINGIGSDAVRAKTGKGWDEWLAILDKAGCRRMNHKEIVAVLAKHHDVGPWWQQMVTVGYEKARGLRVDHEKSHGAFEISRTKTVAVSAAVAFAAWTDKKKRRRWLQDPDFTIRKATEAKSLRITWTDGETALEVNFYAKGDEKCQVAVQHNKLADAAHAERMKAYWAEHLDKLKVFLEG